MDWIKNLKSYYLTGKIENCPKCGGKHVKVNTHENETRKSLTFLCSDCRAYEHFDGIMNKK